jgi:hypothetical protein
VASEHLAEEVVPRVVPPWTSEQVASLNEYQRSGAFHPFTCGQCRDADPDLPLRDDHLLTATVDGWTCPTCDFTQGWAWAWMADGSWRSVVSQVWLSRQQKATGLVTPEPTYLVPAPYPIGTSEADR